MKAAWIVLILAALAMFGHIANPHTGHITCTSDGYGNQQCQDETGLYVSHG